MAQPTQLQYQPVTGPVWSEPVASRLAWLPSVQQPGRSLPPNLLGDFAQPAFDALYKPAGVQWLPSDRYAGRPLPYSPTPYYTRPEFAALYKPEQLGWKPQDPYFARSVLGGRADYAFVQLVAAPVFDPQTLEWIPSGRQPSYLELRRIGDFQQPAFDSLFKPEGLQWLASDRYAGRPLPTTPRDLSVYMVLVIPPADVVPLYVMIDGLHRLSYGLRV